MKNTFLLLLALCCLSANVFAQNHAPIIFIVDASGSMWGKIGADIKMTTAKSVLGELTDNLPADQPLGLVAYGHRREGDCSDIETILPPTNTDHAAFRQAVDGLTPLGKTPLARSATQVIDQLRASGERATVILLTDGVETCEGNLCELVTAAKAEGIDFVLHIVGFDLGAEDRVPLACAAQAGDGLYLDAENGDQLASALQQTTQLTVEEGEASLSVTVLKDGQLRDAAVRVYRAGTEEEVAAQRSYSDETTNPVNFRLPAGRYDLSATLVGERALAPQWRRDLTVRAEDVTSHTFDFTTGKLVVTVTNNGQPHDTGLKVLVEGEARPVYGGRTYTAAPHNPHHVDLSPGSYQVQLNSITIKGDDATHEFPTVEVKPGATTELEHDFASGELFVKVTKDGALADATVAVSNSSGSVDGNRTYTADSSNPTRFLLSPGTYTVKIRGVRVAGDPQSSFEVTVPAGGQVHKEVAW